MTKGQYVKKYKISLRKLLINEINGKEINMLTELISIIVPVYNAEKYINRCVESLINQTYKNIEIILIDDGSKDASLNLCKMWAKKDKRVKVIHTENQGVSSARNIGLKEAKGLYIGFVDSDDYIDSKMYELLLSSIEKNNSDISFCGVNYIYKDKIIKSSNYGKVVCEKKYFFKHHDFNNKMNYNVWNKLFKQNLIQNMKFNPNIKISEDGLFVMQYINKVEKIACVNENLYYYNCMNENSTLNSNSIEKLVTSLEARRRIIEIFKQNKVEEYLQEECNYIGSLYKYINRARSNPNIDFSTYKKVAKRYIEDGLLKQKLGVKNKIKVFIYKLLLKI